MATERATRFAVGACLTAPFAYLFSNLMLGEKALFWRDVLLHYWPLRTTVARSLSRGELPLWDDGVLGGVPLLANVHAAVLYPANLLYQVMAFPSAYGLLMAAHLVLLAWGTALVLRHFSSWPAAVGGALSFALGGHVLGLVDCGPNLMAHAWIPWALLALQSQAPLPRRIAWFAATVAAQVLAGDPMSVVLTLVAALCLVPLLPSARGAAVCVVAGGALGALLCAAQLFPSYALLQESTRAAPGPEVATEWALHPARLAELFLPQPFGAANTANPFWARFTSVGRLPAPFSGCVYLGTATLVVAVLGARRGRPLTVALVLLAVGLVLAMGGLFIAGPLLVHVPPFNLFRYPEKYLTLVALGVAVLVAASIDGVVAEPRGPRYAAALALVALLAAAAATVQWAGLAFLPWPRGIDTAVAAGTIGAALGSAALVGLCTVGLPFALRHRGPGMVTAGLVAVVALDLLGTNQSCFSWGPSELYEQRSDLVDAMQQATTQRPFRYWRDDVALDARKTGLAVGQPHLEAVAAALASLESRVASIYGLEELSGLALVVFERWEQVSRALYLNGRTVHDRMYNACFVVAAPSRPSTRLDGLPVVMRLPTAVLLQHPDCLPRLHGVERVAGAKSFEDALQQLTRTGFDPAATAIVEGAPSRDGLAPLRVLSQSHRPGLVEATVAVGGGSAFLVAAEPWSRGWVALIDGVPTSLWVVNGTLLGLSVAEGTHSLVLRYEQPGLNTGLAVSAVAVLLTAALALMRQQK